MELLVVGLVLAGIVIAYGWYVVLIRRRNRALEALSSIDVQLHKRHDLLPNILKLAERFMAHERDLLTRVTELRQEARRPYDATDSEAVRRHLEAERGLRSEEHTSELQSRENLVCRLLLEKKNNTQIR